MISPNANTITTREFNVVESTDRIPKAPSGKTDQINKKAREFSITILWTIINLIIDVFERYDDDALDHLVETDDLT